MDHKKHHAKILERRRQSINQRLDAHKARINARFDEKQARMSGKRNSKQEEIIEAGLELLSQGGLPAVSLRDLARLLNLQAPALYWYFKNKEDLVDYMAEAILQKEFPTITPRSEGELWQDWLTNHMVRLRKAMLAYPDGARVVAGAHIYPAMTLARSGEASLEALHTAGVALQTARHITTTATHYTFGYVIEEQAAPTREQLASIDLVELLKPYPYVRMALKEMEPSPHSIDQDFLTGLKYIIDGSGAK